MLNQLDTLALIKECQNNNADAKEKILTENTPLIKSVIKRYIGKGIEFDDLGTTDLEHVIPYYAVASKVAPLVQDGTYEKAVLICGTGAGMSVVSNKFKGVYAVACEGIYSAKMARAINNANILCMGGWIVGPEIAVEMVKTFLNTEWCQDLEDWRKENMKKFAVQVKAIEDKACKD